jgi:hypothetical protein
MKPRVLIIVAGDPRSSGRPAEAVRIAAGVGTWQRVEIALYLRGEAARVLGESTDELVDETDYARYWPVLAESGQTVYVEKDAPALKELGAVAMPFTEISDGQLAELAAQQACVLRF